MPDDPTPPPAPQPEAIPGPTPGQLPKTYMEAFVLNVQVASAALKPAYAGTLAAETEFDANALAEFATAIEATRRLGAQATHSTTGRMLVTTAESDAQQALVREIRHVQARARSAYKASAPENLRDFFIGERTRIDASRARLETVAFHIAERLEQKPLPALPAPRLAALKAALARYLAVQVEQGGEQSVATAARRELATQMAALANTRRAIQAAADALWPPAPDNDGVRREFRLPLRKAFRG